MLASAADQAGLISLDEGADGRAAVLQVRFSGAVFNGYVAQWDCCRYASSVTETIDVDADLDAAFAALGDRTRRAILTRLARGDATVGELAEPFDLTHQAISRHVGILRRCGLIDQRVDGQRRPCRLNVDRMQELVSWIAVQQREWESRLDRLEGHLASVQERSQ